VELPALRRLLELLPSPVPDRPGLLIRDPRLYTPSVIVIPPPLVPFLAFFDGAQSLKDLNEALVRSTGDVRAASLATELHESLSRWGFLEDETFSAMKVAKEAGFRAAPAIPPTHAGSAYPAEAEPLARALDGYLELGDAGAPPPEDVVAIGAPHVSPEGGGRSYGNAYRLAARLPREATYVVLGTSHSGLPNRFGLTGRPFSTPFGQTSVDPEAVAALVEGAPGAVIREDYAFASEHSVEFQVVFLQHALGAPVRVVPVLCGPLLARDQGLPEDEEAVGAFFSALRRLAEERGGGLVFVLGIDWAHVGRRYGDPFPAEAGEGPLLAVEARDRARLERICAGDAEGFWRLLGDDDPLKWCGTSPLYTFLRAVPEARGQVLSYDQWNIDPESVVSFGALAFFRKGVR
jgi:AmmeMemoRadiSam system protein B